MSNPSRQYAVRLVSRSHRRTADHGWFAGKIAGMAIYSLMMACSLVFVQPVLAAQNGADVSEIQAHLAAGEFGLALEKAQKIDDEQTRQQQLKAIGAAQEQAGEFEGAQATSRRAGMKPEANEELQGGSTADPSALMDLIEAMTGGPNTGTWEDEDLEGENGGPAIEYFENGVSVDPNGLLVRLTRPELTKRLDQLGILARKAILNQDLQGATDLRFVSLTRLEREVAERLKAGQQPLETMKLLGGLTGIKYIFVLPEEKELVIAGPAEAWRYNEHGLAVGVSSGRPVLQLDDLVTLLRTFGPAGNRTFGCSIDPRAENLKATKDFVTASNRPLAPGALPGWLQQIEKRMGLQDIRIYGVPNNSRVARVIVDADYRMKLIGVGKMQAGPGIPSIFDLMARTKSDDKLPLNAYRWWLTMKYDAVLHNESKNVFEILGSSVLVKSEDQMISDAGKQVQAGKTSGANRQFAENFTKNYGSLAKQDLVFADLQNVFDLGMVAALCHTEHLADKIGWDLGAFRSGGEYAPQAWPAPTTVQTVLAHRVQNGTNILVQAAGGVQGNLVDSIKGQTLVRESADVKPLDQEGTAPAKLPAGRWWWNASK